jgi:hypothetical protein
MVKSNLAAPMPSLSFVLEEADNGAVRVDWLGEVGVAATDLLTGPRDEGSSALEAAKSFLVELLLEGPVPHAEVEARRRGPASTCAPSSGPSRNRVSSPAGQAKPAAARAGGSGASPEGTTRAGHPRPV